MSHWKQDSYCLKMPFQQCYYFCLSALLDVPLLLYLQKGKKECPVHLLCIIHHSVHYCHVLFYLSLL